MSTSLCSVLPMAALATPPIIHSDDGPVQGSRRFDGLLTYHGIPFAAPPIGDLRLAFPQRPAPWKSTLQAVDRRPICPQFNFAKGVHMGSEDCLYLSVYVPVGCTEATPCPVMQWIFGGAWIMGDNDEFGLYDGSRLATAHGVVVVAANYRLDSLGWLALAELQHEDAMGDGAYGNYGLHDQRLALRWVQSNIRRFGGEPHAVTIFGESAGGVSVCQHLASPASNRLFSHAIMESGTCDGPWITVDGADAKRFGDAYATAAGCPPQAAPHARIACLRGLPLRDIQMPYLSWLCPWKRVKDPWCNTTLAHAQPPLRAWPTPRPPLAPIAGFVPVIDGAESGLPEAPLARMRRGVINVSPMGSTLRVILGTNTDELALFIPAMPLVVPGLPLPASDSSVSELVHHLVAYHEQWTTNTAQAILHAYPRDVYPHAAGRLVALGTDLVFKCPTRSAARALAAHGVPTYLYQYDFHGAAYMPPVYHTHMGRPPSSSSSSARATLTSAKPLSSLPPNPRDSTLPDCQW